MRYESVYDMLAVSGAQKRRLVTGQCSTPAAWCLEVVRMIVAITLLRRRSRNNRDRHAPVISRYLVTIRKTVVKMT
jgi:hypothetical protein